MKRRALAISLVLALAGVARAQDPPKPADPAPPKPADPAPPKPADKPADAPKDDPAAKPATPQKYSLAVLTFTFTDAVREKKDGITEEYLKEFETNALTSKLVSDLVKTQKFDVVDRDRLEKVLKEQHLGDAGTTDPARCVKTGKLVGADYLLSGQITVFSVYQKTFENPYAPGNYTITLVPDMVVDMRLVDARTGKIFAADKVEAKQTFKFQSTSKNFGISTKLVDDLERDLCSRLSLRVLDGLYPIKVIAWKDGVAFLNRGEGQGLVAGQVLDVFKTGEDLVDPDTGAVLGSTETKIGTLKVTSVELKFSKAAPCGTTTLESVPKGSICRAAKEAPGADEGKDK